MADFEVGELVAVMERNQWTNKVINTRYALYEGVYPTDIHHPDFKPNPYVHFIKYTDQRNDNPFIRNIAKLMDLRKTTALEKLIYG